MPTKNQLDESRRVFHGIFGNSTMYPCTPSENENPQHHHSYQKNILNSKEDWINPKIKVCKGGVSELHQNLCYGLHVEESISQDDPVVIFGNRSYVSKEKINKLLNSEFYIIQWDEDLFSYEKPQEDIGWFINHSCNPNSWIKTGSYFEIVALRNIEKGEEVTIDYATFCTEITILSNFDCNCGSSECRKVVSHNDWQNKDLQEKYFNHFSPFLNKKIKSMI